MTDLFILESLQKFIEDEVASKIKFQKATDNVNDFSLINPSVHVGYLPPKNYLPPGMESEVPCVIVGMESGEDNGKKADLNIRISFAVYCPGLYAKDPTDLTGTKRVFTPSFDGYKNLLNLMTRTRKTLSENMVIEKTTSLNKPFKWGMYEEQPYPYWYGWLTFTAQAAVIDRIESNKNNQFL